MRIINGKKEIEVYEALKAAFPDSALKYDESRDITYLKGEEVMARMEQVLGFNYSEEFDGCVIEEIPDANGEIAPFVRMKCTIRIYDDDHNLVKSRSRWGGTRIIRIGKGDRAGAVINLGNDLDTACTDAFKRCARAFGVTSPKVGKGNQLRRYSNYKSLNVTNEKQKEVPVQKGEVYQIQYLSEFMSKGNAGGYFANVKINGQEVAELIIWNNDSGPFVKMYGDMWYKMPYAGKSGKILGKLKNYHGKKQIIFSGFSS